MGLNVFDFVLIAFYLAGVTLFGLHFRKRQRSLRDYFLAGRDVPWWAISLSIVAAETSTLTVISVPGLAYDGSLVFLQLVLGYLVGRVIICFTLLPQYFRGELYTAYELIGRRFGNRLRSLTAGVFLLTRAAAEGVRVFAVAIVVGLALGSLTGTFSEWQRDFLSVGIVILLTLLYTFEGGMTAVIWTDVLQLGIYLTGTLVAFISLLHLIPGGWPAVVQAASAHGKLQVFDFSLDFHRTYTFWCGVIGGMFLTTASHGTDQLIVQRLLAARNQAQSRLALLSSGVVVLLQFSIFLLLGTVLWVFYRATPGTHFSSTDRIFPTFIVARMPHGVSGIMIAAVLAAAMSNLSAALNALSSTSVIDFYLRWNPDAPEQRRLRLSRFSTVAWALVILVVAMASRNSGKVVEVGLAIASVAYGGLLGVFLLGILTRKANERGCILGMIAGLVANVYIWQGATLLNWLQQASGTPLPRLALSRPIPFPWYVPIGTIITFAIGYSSSLLLAPESPRANGAIR